MEEHPEVIGFDALGRRLTFSVWRTPSGSRLGRALGLRREGVTVTAQDGAPAPDALHALLSAYLQAVAPAWRPADIEPRTAAEYAASLPALLAAASRAGAGR